MRQNDADGVKLALAEHDAIAHDQKCWNECNWQAYAYGNSSIIDQGCSIPLKDEQFTKARFREAITLFT
jgi:hypothetical protein